MPATKRTTRKRSADAGAETQAKKKAKVPFAASDLSSQKAKLKKAKQNPRKPRIVAKDLVGKKKALKKVTVKAKAKRPRPIDLKKQRDKLKKTSGPRVSRSPIKASPTKKKSTAGSPVKSPKK